MSKTSRPKTKVQLRLSEWANRHHHRPFTGVSAWPVDRDLPVLDIQVLRD